MKHTFIVGIILILCIPNGQATSQVPAEKIVPSPDFAEYQPEFSHMMQAMIGELGGREEESGGTGMEYVYYESIEADVQVYTTPLSVDEVREKYFDLFIEDMKAQGIPVEAVPQFKQFLDDEVIDEIKSEPMADGDPDILEAYFREAGSESSLQWIECYRTLYPELKNKVSRTFLIEMDELRFHHGSGESPTEYTLVEVEVQQPYIDPRGCKIENGTAITYSVYRMVAVDS
jgi:hypothetical protein